MTKEVNYSRTDDGSLSFVAYGKDLIMRIEGRYFIITNPVFSDHKVEFSVNESAASLFEKIDKQNDDKNTSY